MMVVTFFCSFLHNHMPAPRLFYLFFPFRTSSDCVSLFFLFLYLYFLDPLDQNLERGVMLRFNTVHMLGKHTLLLHFFICHLVLYCSLTFRAHDRM
jgi:hypothetical protein